MKLRAIFIAILLSMLSSSSIEAVKVKPVIMRLGLLSKGLSIGLGYLTGKILDVNECEVPVSIFVGLMTTCVLYPLLRWYEKRHIPENIFNKKYISDNDKELAEIATNYQNLETLVMKIARKYLNKEEYLLSAVDAMNKLHRKLTRKQKRFTYACSLCDLEDEDDQNLYKQIKEELSKIEKVIHDLTEAIVIIKIIPEWSLEVNRKNMKVAIAWASIPTCYYVPRF